jgi:hypothetical protein
MDFRSLFFLINYLTTYCVLAKSNYKVWTRRGGLDKQTIQECLCNIRRAIQGNIK